jgi:hypothetical protein
MERLLEFDPASFREHFAKEPFEVRHRLHDHSLFSMEAVAELADKMPSQYTGRIAAELPVAWGERDRIPRGVDEEPGEVVRNISSSASRVMLWEIEQMPAYRELIDACLDELQACVQDTWGPLVDRMVRAFVSSPGSVTPAHFDNDQNLICQLRGTKTLSVGKYASPLEERKAIEHWWDTLCSMNIKTLPPEHWTFELKPGMGVYIPPLAPHWTYTGDEPSVTLSMFFHTRASARYSEVQALNALLRRRGRNPRPPGESEWIDHTKAALVRGAYLVTGRHSEARRRRRFHKAAAGDSPDSPPAQLTRRDDGVAM